MRAEKDIDNGFIVKLLANGGTTMFLIYWTLVGLIGLSPWMFLLQVVGSLMWVVAGIKWRDWSVIAQNTFVATATFISLFVY